MSVTNLSEYRSNKQKNNSDGFAMNDRSILKTDWYKNINARLIYLELSLRVAHTGFKTTFNGHNISLSKGQYVTKETSLAKVIDGTRNQAVWALKILEKNGVIIRKTLGTARNKCTIITLNLSEKQQPRESRQSNYETPCFKGVVGEVTTTEQPCESPVNQEGTKSIKDIYVKNDKSLLVRDVKKIFNESFPNLASVQKINNTRKSRLMKIFKDYSDFENIEHWKGFFDYLQHSDFLMGRASDWQMTFDFMINPANFLKIIEGNYENK